MEENGTMCTCRRKRECSYVLMRDEAAFSVEGFRLGVGLVNV